MNTRRTFLTTLLKSGLFAVTTPQIITSGLGLKVPRWRINPAYIDAPYEISFINIDRMIKSFQEDYPLFLTGLDGGPFKGKYKFIATEETAASVG